MKKALTIIVIIILVLVAAFLLIKNWNQINLETYSDFPKEAYLCKVDGDCVKMTLLNRCGCTGGGKDTVANNEYYENYIKGQLSDIYCPAVMSNHWTCKASPKCVNNNCRLVK
jgi:hypothetical protein